MFLKIQYIGGIAEKGGLVQFVDVRGGLVKKERGRYRRGIDTLMFTMLGLIKHEKPIAKFFCICICIMYIYIYIYSNLGINTTKNDVFIFLLG